MFRINFYRINKNKNGVKYIALLFSFDLMRNFAPLLKARVMGSKGASLILSNTLIIKKNNENI